MDTYKIKGEYIKNKIAFVLAITGCIYSEILRLIEDIDDYEVIDEYKYKFDDLVRCLMFILKVENNPYDIISNRFDMLELSLLAGAYNQVQTTAWEVADILPEKIKIEISPKNEIWTDWINFLPNFKGKVEIDIL